MIHSLKTTLIAACAALLLGLSLGGAAGYSLGKSKYENLKRDLEVAQGKVEFAQNLVLPIVEKERIVYRDRVQKLEVPKIIEKEVYKNVCLDAEGVSAFNTLMGN